MRAAWMLGLVLAGCGDDQPAREDAAPSDTAALDAPVRGLPLLQTTQQLCKLLSDLNVSDPTANDVQHRANILGADLGILVDHADTLYIFFGDTIGFAGIWGAGESHPDAVAFGLDSAAAIAVNPAALCTRLGVITLAPGASIGPTIDPSIQADFAAGAMTAPSGHTLGEYIHNPSGAGGSTFPNLPGDFEVPSGAFSAGGSIYVFYTTVVSPTDITMKGSYLARWAAPSTTSPPSYDILYAVDQRFDSSGALHGNFINVAAVAHGEYVYLFGTGEFRASPVHLARKRLDALAVPGAFEEYDAATSTWSPTSPPAPIISTIGYGETSVRYFATIDRWMFLAEELTATTNRIVARFADRPEGPWSDAIVVHDMADPVFQAAHCCVPENSCQGSQFFNCTRTGFYGSYLFPTVQLHGDGSFTATYTLSSFDPYNVALFSAMFR